jgi:hypothetical protein
MGSHISLDRDFYASSSYSPSFYVLNHPEFVL